MAGEFAPGAPGGAPDTGNLAPAPGAAPQDNPGQGGGEGGSLFDNLFEGSPAPGGQAPTPGAAPGEQPPAGEGGGTPPAPGGDIPKPGEKPPVAPPEWLKGLPPELQKHPALQDKASPQAVLEDYLKLKDAVGNYTPLEKPEDLSAHLKLPQGMDKTLANQNGELDWLADKAVKGKFSAEQTQFIFDSFNEFRTTEWNTMNKVGQEAIKSMWGNEFQANKDAVGKALNMVGQRMGQDGPQRLAAYVASHPAVGSSPVFAEMMMVIAKSVSPESLPAGVGQPQGTGAVDTATFLGSLKTA